MKTPLLALLLCSASLHAQVPDAPGAAPLPAPAAAPAQPAAGGQKPGGFLGKDAPAFDPGSEVMTWDGKAWNINNNRLFQARFEKYLNAPEETTADDAQYRTIIETVLQRLAPGAATPANLDYAFRLLQRGSHYDADARLCDSLANAVYTVWTAQRQQTRLVAANEAMNWEIQRLELETKSSSAAVQHAQQAKQKTKAPGKGGQGQPAPTASEQAAEAKESAVETSNYKTRRLAEMITRQKTNDVKRELSEIAAKVEFQAMIVQFFLQRRYQHVVMATRFYRALFNDGDTKLNMGKDATELFQRSTGLPPTLSTLDTMTNEAIRDVREGVKAFDFLLTNNELESATKRLAEAFTIGEYMPEVRTLQRDKKRRVVDFSHKSFQLLSALEVKDYTLAETIVKDLAVSAKDFDSSKPMAAIETSRTVARMHLAEARNAALSGDKVALKTSLTAATEVWPRNPELAEISKMIFSQGDVQQKAVIDFDQLLGQKNYRQIYEDGPRYIAALALYPAKQELLKQVMENMKAIETAVMRADEMAKQSNYAGAWESVERAFAKFPDDSKLNQQRANLTTQAAEFVRTIRNAQDLEKQEQVGSSLAWYLKAQKLYPASDFAGEGVGRLVKKILPEA